MLIATRTGHLGPTVFRTMDGGKTWKEATTPPAFPPDAEKAVKFVFWLTPGHSSERGVWYAGTSPQGLFKSEDHGDTWRPFDEFNEYPLIKDVTKNNEGTPIGPLLHSINVSPENKDHLILAMSLGGCFETKDGGQSWSPFNQNLLADFLPDPYPETGQCVHNMQMHPTNPSMIYQQGHCGVYRINRQTDEQWTRIGNGIPQEVGDIGFPLIVHPRDDKQIWVIPMDGSDVWPRTSVDGKPAVFHTNDGGDTWDRQDTGLPGENAWFTVLRQSSTHDWRDPLGLYFGNKAGEIWGSSDEGNSWSCIVRHLPEVYSLEVVQ